LHLVSNDRFDCWLGSLSLSLYASLCFFYSTGTAVLWAYGPESSTWGLSNVVKGTTWASGTLEWSARAWDEMGKQGESIFFIFEGMKLKGIDWDWV